MELCPDYTWLDMQANCAYTVGMQYTLRNIPKHLDALLRKRAEEEHKSLNETAIEAMMRGFGLSGQPVQQRDLDDIAGSWKQDEETEQALEAQRQIDPEIWK